MKTGSKTSGQATVLYLQRDESLIHARFGFIVSKAVAGAIGRNLIKRRLRAIAKEILENQPTGFNAVIRAMPDAKGFEWNRLHQEVLSNVNAALSK